MYQLAAMLAWNGLRGCTNKNVSAFSVELNRKYWIISMETLEVLVWDTRRRLEWVNCNNSERHGTHSWQNSVTRCSWAFLVSTIVPNNFKLICNRPAFSFMRLGRYFHSQELKTTPNSWKVLWSTRSSVTTQNVSKQINERVKFSRWLVAFCHLINPYFKGERYYFDGKLLEQKPRLILSFLTLTEARTRQSC